MKSTIEHGLDKSLHIFITFNMIATKYLTILVSIIIIPQLVSSYEAELFSNGDFENGWNGWYFLPIYQNNGSISINSTLPIPAYSGSYAARTLGNYSGYLYTKIHYPLDGEVILSLKYATNTNSSEGSIMLAIGDAINTYYGPTDGWMDAQLNMTGYLSNRYNNGTFSYDTFTIYMYASNAEFYVLIDNVSVIYNGPTDIYPSPSSSATSTPSFTPIALNKKGDNSITIPVVVSTVISFIFLVVVSTVLIVFRSRWMKTLFGTESIKDDSNEEELDNDEPKPPNRVQRTVNNNINSNRLPIDNPHYNNIVPDNTNYNNVDNNNYNNIVPNNSNYNNMSAEDINRLGTGHSNYNN